MKSIVKPTGKLRIRVIDSEGNLKQEVLTSNVVTDSGDAYIADLLSSSPVRTKITTGSCYIPVGTGWTGTTPKANTWVNTQVGSSQAVDATYPKLKGAWGTVDDNVLQFQVTYLPGSLNVIGINEAAITSHASNVAANSILSYAQITPAVNVSSTDTLVILWEVTFVGS